MTDPYRPPTASVAATAAAPPSLGRSLLRIAGWAVAIEAGLTALVLVLAFVWYLVLPGDTTPFEEIAPLLAIVIAAGLYSAYLLFLRNTPRYRAAHAAGLVVTLQALYVLTDALVRTLEFEPVAAGVNLASATLAFLTVAWRSRDPLRG